jgi:DNA/RNA-binding domain of Phe-tRNA-synthetase-like protein
MKSFIVEKAVFDKLPDYCVGVVVATGLDNHRQDETVAQMLDKAAADFAEANKEANVRELPGVKACRDAFLSLSMNPNKFMCSIESLMKRVQKTGALPHINTVVDLGNAFSLNYQLPIGAHDIDKLEDNVEIRFSTIEDHFLPMGEAELENMPEGELVYVSGHTVKTRRWIWRQSEDGKIGEDTSHVFSPIDGFKSVTGDAVIEARDQLAKLLSEHFNCQVVTGYVDKDNNSFDFE